MGKNMKQKNQKIKSEDNAYEQCQNCRYKKWEKGGLIMCKVDGLLKAGSLKKITCCAIQSQIIIKY